MYQGKEKKKKKGAESSGYQTLADGEPDPLHPRHSLLELRQSNATHSKSSAITRAASPVGCPAVGPGNRPKQIQMRRDSVDKNGIFIERRITNSILDIRSNNNTTHLTLKHHLLS